jgi:hypothetical protein
MHDQCIHLVTAPALPSYVTLRQCLTMARDAQNMTDTNGADQIGRIMKEPKEPDGGLALQRRR